MADETLVQAMVDKWSDPQELSRVYVDAESRGDKRVMKAAEYRLLQLMDEGIYPSNEDLAAFYDFRNNAKITERLVQHFDVNALEHHGYSFLVAHADSVSMPVLKLHVQAGAKVVRYKEQGPLKPQWWYETPMESCPLMDAIRKGRLDQVKVMLASGTVPLQYEKELNLNGKPTKAWIGGPLHLAIESGHLDIAKYLRRKGAKSYTYHERLVLQGKALYVSDDNQLIEGLLPEHN